MQKLNTLITDMLGPFGPLMLVGLLGVFLILVTLPVLMKKQADPLDRLKAQNCGRLKVATSLINMPTFWSHKTVTNIQPSN